MASTLSSATSPWVNGRMSTSRAGSTCGLPPPCTEPVTTAIWVSIAEPLALPSTVQFAVPNSTASCSVTPGTTATTSLAAAAMKSPLMPFGL